MADWSKPTLTSTYTNFLSEVTSRDTDLALQFDGTTSSNLTTGTIRWDSSANRWKKWSGTAWGELATTYALTGLSTTGNASVGGTLGVTGATTLATATATTPATSDNTTNVATTAFVKAQGYAPLASPTFTGTVTIPAGASISGYLTTATAGSTYAPLASPTLTGTPAAPTAAQNTSTTQLATTAFVLGQASSTTPVINGTAAVGTGTTFARADHVHPTDTTRAPLASPTFTGTVTIPAGASISGFAPLASPTFTGTVTIPAGASISGYLTTSLASTTYAPLASPALTGTPTAPTATAGTSTTQVATTAFVAASYAPLASPTFTGTVTIPAGASISGYLTTSLASTTYAPLASPTFTGTVTIPAGASISGYAPLASPTLTGVPAAPTAAVDTNTTQLATTAYVLAQAASATPVINGTAAAGTSTRYARADHVHPTDTTRAALATAQSFTAAQRGSITALTDGATITPDFAAANNFSVTLGGSRTLANPTNLTAGQSGTIVITQDATGGRTLAYGTNWKFPSGTAPTLTTVANAVDVLAYYVESSTRITARLVSDVK